MAQNSNQPLLWKFTAWLLVVAGVGFFLLYVLRDLTGFSVATTATTLAYYAFASFGATIIPWGSCFCVPPQIRLFEMRRQGQLRSAFCCSQQ